MELKIVQIVNPSELNLILGQSHFIKTIEDVQECLANAVPSPKYGVAFCEASGPCLIRFAGTDPELVDLAKQNAQLLSCGHCFIIFMKDMFPLHIMRHIKQIPEVVSIFAATANPLQVIVAQTEQGRGIMGVIDGQASKGIESDKDIEQRKSFLRTIGYKF